MGGVLQRARVADGRLQFSRRGEYIAHEIDVAAYTWRRCRTVIEVNQGKLRWRTVPTALAAGGVPCYRESEGGRLEGLGSRVLDEVEEAAERIAATPAARREHQAAGKTGTC